MSQQEYTPTGKIYEIKSIEDLFGLPGPQRERCAEEILACVRIHNSMQELADVIATSIHPELKVEMPLESFTWVDDGERIQNFRFVE